MKDDPRMFLFYLLHDQRQGGENTKTLSYETVYKELLERRFDEVFVNAMASSLKAMSSTLHGLQSKMSDQLEGERVISSGWTIIVMLSPKHRRVQHNR